MLCCQAYPHAGVHLVNKPCGGLQTYCPTDSISCYVVLGPMISCNHDSRHCRFCAHSCAVGLLLCAYFCGCWLLQMGIANRDIKLENTLLMDLSERPVLKLCDFGYSKDELCASISKTMCGKQALLPCCSVVMRLAMRSKSTTIFSCTTTWVMQKPDLCFGQCFLTCPIGDAPDQACRKLQTVRDIVALDISSTELHGCATCFGPNMQRKRAIHL